MTNITITSSEPEVNYQGDGDMTTVLMKNGATVQVDIDDLSEFWSANKDNIQLQKFIPRRPRANSRQSQ
jgi:hypothetical protein